MIESTLAQKTILILGLGETGSAAARWCVQQGAQVRIADTRQQPPGLEALQSLGLAQDAWFLGEQQCYGDAVLAGVDSLVLSPGLEPNEVRLSAFLDKARAASVEIIGEIELFARALSDLAQAHDYQPSVLAITGTNGKTTVTTMVRDMCLQAGKTALAAGNISPSALTALMQALAEQALPDVWVLELSSFQMVTTESLKPHASVVLNITQDHLDWHGSLEHYAASKAKLLKMSHLAVINRDDPLTPAMVEHMDDLHVASFGLDMPELVGDMGVEQLNGISWLCAMDDDEFDMPVSSGRKKKITERPTRKSGQVKRLMPADAMRVRGRHNAANALAAMILCRAIGLSYAPLLTALRDYQAQAHRCVFVRSIQGVDFIDDSKGTNVGATQAALLGMERRVVLIAGGLGKGQDFSPLAIPVKQYARALVLIGQDRQIIADALNSTDVPIIFSNSLEEAVSVSLQHAQEGDVVLLSPACASMDMFKNYHERGEMFVQAVEQLARDQGEML